MMGEKLYRVHLPEMDPVKEAFGRHALSGAWEAAEMLEAGATLILDLVLGVAVLVGTWGEIEAALDVWGYEILGVVGGHLQVRRK